MNSEDRFLAKATMMASAFLGRASMLFFVIFLFAGSLDIIRMGLTHTMALVWDAFLSCVFFLQHSFMIRRRFRAYMEGIIPSHYLDAFFAIASSVVLTLVVVFWQSTSTVLLELEGFSRWTARGVFCLTMAGVVWGVSALKSFDPFGRTSIKAFLKGGTSRPREFKVYGPYLWVRHPLYFFMLLLIWSYPVLTTDRLLFNVLWTAWIYLGTRLEEKDLVSDFGEKYRAYQKEVPMLIPWKKPSYKGAVNTKDH